MYYFQSAKATSSSEHLHLINDWETQITEIARNPSILSRAQIKGENLLEKKSIEDIKKSLETMKKKMKLLFQESCPNSF